MLVRYDGFWVESSAAAVVGPTGAAGAAGPTGPSGDTLSSFLLMGA